MRRPHQNQLGLCQLKSSGYMHPPASQPALSMRESISPDSMQGGGGLCTECRKENAFCSISKDNLLQKLPPTADKALAKNRKRNSKCKDKVAAKLAAAPVAEEKATDSGEDSSTGEHELSDESANSSR